MPYTGPGDTSLPSNIKDLPETKRAQWVAVFNSAMSKCQPQNGDDCEAVAFRQANGVVFDEMEIFTPPAELGIDGLLSARAVRRLAEDGGSWARKVTRKLNNAKEAAMKLNEVAKTAADGATASEMYDDAIPHTAGAATSFVDLQTAQQANEAAEQIHKLTYQFQTLVENIMYDQAITDKGAAVEALAGEFVDLARMAFGAEMEETAPELPTTDLSEIAISESSIGHVTRMLEAGDVITGGSRPLLLEVVPIQPGWGNERDNNYYPASMLERCFATAFDGVKMYETNHIPAEINNKNWVSTYVKTDRFKEGAPIGLVGVHDPLFAQKIINLVELEKSTGELLLNKLECSIRGGGSATPGFELDGRSGKRVQELSQGLSIDWVSRGGAKGHATRLLESEEEVMKEDTKELDGGNVQTEPVEEVEIAETTPDKTQVEPEPVVAAPAQAEPVAPQEVTPEPAPLSEADIKALVPDHLPDETKARLLGRQFASEDDAREVIAIEINYLMAVTDSGKPAMAEKQQPESALINVPELAKEQAVRQTAVNDQFLGA